MKAFLRKTFQNFKNEVLFTRTFLVVLISYLLFSFPLLDIFIISHFNSGFISRWLENLPLGIQFICNQWGLGALMLNLPGLVPSGMLIDAVAGDNIDMRIILIAIAYLLYVFIITSVIATSFIWNKKVGWGIVGLMILAVGGYLFTEMYRIDKGQLVCKESFPCAGGWERIDMPYCTGVGYQCKSGSLDSIKNFDDCVAAGNPVQESYPARCTTVTGYTYTQEIEE